MPHKSSIARFAKRLSPKVWLNVACMAVLLTGIILWCITPVRNWLVNTMGVRAQLTVTVQQQTLASRLSGAEVVIDGKTYTSNSEGMVQAAVVYGNVHIRVSKQDYESDSRDITLNFPPFFYIFGGKEADEAARHQLFELKAISKEQSTTPVVEQPAEQVTNAVVALRFVAVDWLNSQPITAGTFRINDSVARPNSKGEFTLYVRTNGAATARLSANFGGSYNDTTMTVNTVSGARQVLTFVPGGKHYFVNYVAGAYGLYRSNIDGSNLIEIPLPSTIDKSRSMQLAVSPHEQYAALQAFSTNVSNFGHEREIDAVNLKSGAVNVAASRLCSFIDAAGGAYSSYFSYEPIDWTGDNTMIYNYHCLSYDTDWTGVIGVTMPDLQKKVYTQFFDWHQPMFTGHGSRCTSAHIVLDRLMCVYNDDYDSEKLALFDTTTGGKQIIDRAQDLAQVSATQLVYQATYGVWRQYNVATGQVTTSTVPAQPARQYLGHTSADGTYSLYYDEIRGVRTLVVQRVSDGHETVLYTGNDLTGPARWIGNNVAYRAGFVDYVVSPLGGSAKKIVEIGWQDRGNGYTIPAFNFNAY